jgi:hypothetical protein
MSHPRKVGLRAAVLAVSAVAVTAITTAVATAGGGAKKTSGTVYVGTTPKPGALLYVAGFATDKVLGPTAVTYVIKPTSAMSGTLTANVKKITVWAKDGTLSGKGSATVTITNKPKAGDATVSNGKASLKQGTGCQVGHSLIVTFTGHGNAISGQYVFNYKGSYR